MAKHGRIATTDGRESAVEATASSDGATMAIGGMTAPATAVSMLPMADPLPLDSPRRAPYIGAVVHYHDRTNRSTVEAPVLMPVKASIIIGLVADEEGQPADRVNLMVFYDTTTSILKRPRCDTPTYGGWSWIPEANDA
jgi:queuine/archaeosine tRNA-ribosyltransferase